jgi:hypothetical protein
MMPPKTEHNNKGKRKATSSPARELKMGAPASSSRSRHDVDGEAETGTSEIINLEDDDNDAVDEYAPSSTSKTPISPKAHRAEAIGVAVKDDNNDSNDNGHASDTGSFQSDSMDPSMFAATAVLDEEEGMTIAGSASSSSNVTGSAKKPSTFQGGFNAMKQTADGRYYSGMGIGMSHTW